VLKNAARAYLRHCIEKPVFWNEDESSPLQKEMALRIAHLLETVPDCHNRSCLPAHITASAFVIHHSCTATVLLFHRKIKKWMQPGGHADGQTVLHGVALKEAKEETGILGLGFLTLPGVNSNAGEPIPFDVDIHKIPEWKSVPEHWHFDVRYVLQAPPDALLAANHESCDAQWVPFADIPRYTEEESVLRMARKLSRMAASS
jgi:8-oxo-dGTP pyrophosphatase MutT (NUDIX family)